MDYSKQDGGTRVLDQGKARTLMTGIGQTVTSNRHTGSHRTQAVAEGIKPGQVVHDRALAQVSKKRETDAALCARAGMDPTNNGLAKPPPEARFPIETGSMSHEEAGRMGGKPKVDQGEDKRTPATGRAKRGGVTQGIL